MTVPPRRGRTLRTRLAVALGGVAAAGVLATALISFGLVRQFAERAAHDDLVRLGSTLATELAAAQRFGDQELRVTRQLLRQSDARLLLVTGDGRIRGEGGALLTGIDTGPILRGREVRGAVDTDAGRLAYVGFPVRGVFASGVLLMRRVGDPLGISAPILARILLAGAAAVAGAVALSTLLARRLTDPLRRLSEATERVAAGDLSQTVEHEAGDEIGELADRFNRMAGALAESRRREREFLAGVSHELRTPLTAVRGYTEALLEGAVDDGPARAEALEVIHAESARLQRLVDDLLDLSRLGAREFGLQVEQADLGETLREAAAAHAQQAQSAGVSLATDVEGERLDALTDAGRVRQVVSNLVENALRVTPQGGAVRIAGRARDGWVEIEVTDTGPGIEREHLPHVFERSYLHRVSGGGGSGLGLAIVRELVLILGGDIGVRSTPGEGTAFHVRIPARPRP